MRRNNNRNVFWLASQCYIKDADEEYTKEFRKFKHASLKTHVDEITNVGYNPNEFFKISCIRNPWDVAKTISTFNYTFF